MKPPDRNPRLIAADMLRAMRADLNLALARWQVQRMVLIPPAERVSPLLVQRPRKLHEWPELRVDDWQVLDRELVQISAQVDELRAFADQQMRRLHCAGGCGRRLDVTQLLIGVVRCDTCPDPSDPLYVSTTATPPNDLHHNRED